MDQENVKKIFDIKREEDVETVMPDDPGQQANENYKKLDNTLTIDHVLSKRRSTSPLVGKKSKLLKRSLVPNESIQDLQEPSPVTQHKDTAPQALGRATQQKDTATQALGHATQQKDTAPQAPGNATQQMDIMLLPGQKSKQRNQMSVPVKQPPQLVPAASTPDSTSLQTDHTNSPKDHLILARCHSPNGMDETSVAGKNNGGPDKGRSLQASLKMDAKYISVCPSPTYPQNSFNIKDSLNSHQGEMPLLVPKQEKLDDYTVPECNRKEAVSKDGWGVYSNFDQTPSRPSSNDGNIPSQTEIVNSSSKIVHNKDNRNIETQEPECPFSESPPGAPCKQQDINTASRILSKESHFSSIVINTLDSIPNILENPKDNDFVQTSRKSTKEMHSLGSSNNISNTFDSQPNILDNFVQTAENLSGESCPDNDANSTLKGESNILESSEDNDSLLSTNSLSKKRHNPQNTDTHETMKNTYDEEDAKADNLRKSKKNVEPLLYVKCGVCSQSFNSVRELQCHMTEHDLRHPYRCNYCPNTYSHIKELQVHIDSHNLDLPYICSICKEVFGQSEILSKHLRESHILEISSGVLEYDIVLGNPKSKNAIRNETDIQENDLVHSFRDGYLEQIPPKISWEVGNSTGNEENLSTAHKRPVQMLEKTRLFSSFVPLPQLDISKLTKSTINVSNVFLPLAPKWGRYLKNTCSLSQRDTVSSQSVRCNLLKVRSKKAIFWSKKHRFGRGRKPKSLTVGNLDQKFRYSICEFCCEVHTNINHHHMTHTHAELKTCGQCNLNLATKASTLRHFLVCHKRSKILTCKFCDLFVGSESKYIQHFLFSHAGGSVMNSESGWLMDVEDSETEHPLKPGELFICKTCCEVVANFKSHQAHTEKELLVCGFCGLKLASKGSVGRHFRNVHKLRGKIPCRVCKEILKSETKYKEHFLKEHPTAKSSKLNVDFDLDDTEKKEMEHRLSLQELSNRSSLPSICPFCCGVFPYMKLHQLKHDKEILTRCGFCKMILATKNSVIRHYNAIHKAQENLTCKKCKQFIGSEDKYMEHFDECCTDDLSIERIDRMEDGNDVDDDEIEMKKRKSEDGGSLPTATLNTSSRSKKSKFKSTDPNANTNKDISMTSENNDMDNPVYPWSYASSDESVVSDIGDVALDKIRKSAKPCVCPFCCGVFPFLKQHQFQHKAEVLTQCGFCKLILATKNSVIRHYNAVHRAHKNIGCERCELFVGSERKYIKHFEKFHRKMNDIKDDVEDAPSFDVNADEDELDDKDLVNVSTYISQALPPKVSTLEDMDEVSVNFGSISGLKHQRQHASHSSDKMEDSTSSLQGRSPRLMKGEISIEVNDTSNISDDDNDDDDGRSAPCKEGVGDISNSSILDVERSRSTLTRENIRTDLDEFIDLMSVCEICSEIHFNLKKHRNEHTDVTNKCGFCNKKFSTRFQTIQHFRRIHRKLKNIYCPVCQKFLGSEELYKRHYLKHHDSQFLDSIGLDKFPDDKGANVKPLHKEVSPKVTRRNDSSAQISNFESALVTTNTSAEGNIDASFSRQNQSNPGNMYSKNSNETSPSQEMCGKKIKNSKLKSINDAESPEQTLTQSSYQGDPGKKFKTFYSNLLKTEPLENDVLFAAFEKSQRPMVNSRRTSLYSLNICRICSEVHWNIKAHSQKHVGKQLKCGFCQSQILRKNLEYHYKSVHLKRGDLSCKICCKPYFTEEAYIKHFFNEHKSICFENLEDFKKSKKQICEICCELHPDLKAHRNLHPSPTQTVCGFCGLTLATRGSLSRHYLTNHKMRQNLNCKFCETFIGSEEKYIRHYKSEHEKRNGHPSGVASDSDQEAAASYECEFCDEKFATGALLKSHVACHEEKAITCETCNHVCYGETQFTNHQTNEHGIQIPEKCSICMEYLPNHQRLLEHISEHRKETDGNGYLCKFCGKTFRLIYSLGQHVKRFHDTNPKFRFECKTCKKGFDSKSFLKSHMRKHSGERPFMCEFCGTGFRVKVSLQMHLNRHTGDRPYKCDQCSKSFKQLSTLQTHQRQHTGSKPYMCQDCGKCFSDRSNFFSHRRTNHKIASETKSSVSGLASYNIGSAFSGFNPFQKF